MTPLVELVLARPDDDAPRLVYADWLDERGNPRGEFIRLQCALARLGPDDPRRPALSERERLLSARHRAEWDRPLAGLADGWDYRRGFPDAARGTARLFLEKAGLLLRTAPVRELDVHDVSGLLTPLAQASWLERLRGLTVYASRNAAVAPALAGSPQVQRLEALRLGRNAIGDDGAAAIAGSPFLARLRELDLGENRLGPAAAAALAASPHLGQVERLDLSGNALGADGARALVDSSALTRLRRLRLARSSIGILQVVARSPGLARLEELDLGGNALGDAGVRDLTGSPHLSALRRLGLSGNDLSLDGLRDLAGAIGLTCVQRLDLADNRLNDDAVRFLVDSPAFGKLTDLDLAGNPFRGLGVRALVNAPLTRPLTRLRLSTSQVDPWLLRPLQQRYGPALRIE
jgi:uncharacterized protein (TIGR02996 family)